MRNTEQPPRRKQGSWRREMTEDIKPNCIAVV